MGRTSTSQVRVGCGRLRSGSEREWLKKVESEGPTDLVSCKGVSTRRGRGTVQSEGKKFDTKGPTSP